MKYTLGCVTAAVLSSLVTAWLIQPNSGADLSAQELRVPGNPLIVPPVPQPVPPVPVEQPVLPQPGYLDDEGISAEEHIAIAVYENTNRSVVNITTKSVRSAQLLPLETVSEGSGSGVVLDVHGHILTNYHVVEQAETINITLYTGKSYEATVVGGDPLNDLSVLKIDAPKNVLHPVQFGDSSRLKVGMRVFAIGNPFELERTMTTGIISSVNRSLQVRGKRSIRSIIQIDAAVNPGNSGGPLLNTRGELIGINVAIASKTGQSSGVGFAIPVNLVARVGKELINHGRFIRPECGIRRVHETKAGLLVLQVDPDSTAARAGLQGPKNEQFRRGPFLVTRVDRSVADIITHIDDEQVETFDDLLSGIESKRAGDTVTLTVQRGDKQFKLPVTLVPGE